MSFLANIPQAVLETIVGHLAPLFLMATATDSNAAADAARHTLAAYNVANEPELNLAAEIISMRMHMLKALAEAADPNLPLNKAMRLRGSAVSLSREAHKSEQQLRHLQHERRQDAAGQPGPQPDPAQHQHTTAQVIEAVQEAVKIASNTKAMTWTQSFQKRQLAKRMAENFKKNSAKHAAAPTQNPEPASPQSP